MAIAVKGVPQFEHAEPLGPLALPSIGLRLGVRGGRVGIALGDWWLTVGVIAVAPGVPSSKVSPATRAGKLGFKLPERLVKSLPQNLLFIKHPQGSPRPGKRPHDPLPALDQVDAHIGINGSLENGKGQLILHSSPVGGAQSVRFQATFHFAKQALFLGVLRLRHGHLGNVRLRRRCPRIQVCHGAAGGIQ